MLLKSKLKISGRYLVHPLAITSIAVLAVLILGIKLVQDKTKEVPQDTEVTIVDDGKLVPLPSPDIKSSGSIEAVFNGRVSQRSFKDESVSVKQIAQLLWSGQGVITDYGERTVTSVKSVYPVNLYLLAYKVDDLDSGLYQYVPGDRQPVHQLLPLKYGDLRQTIYNSLSLSPLKDCSSIIVVTGDFDLMNKAFTEANQDFNVYLEAGATIQNISLQAYNLKLGTISLTTFDRQKLEEIITLPSNQTIISLLPIGNPKE